MLKRNKLSVDEMIDMENKLQSSVLYTFTPQKKDVEVAKALGLQVVYEDDEKMQRGVEAELAPPTQDSYNGIIKIRKSLEENPFAFTHEIIHYVFDVGVGNRVQTSFTRKAKGEPKDIHEQMIDYGAAANRMRYDRVVKDIKRYDTASPRLNPASFVNELCKTYNADRPSVIRRIQEVRKISRKKSLV